MKTLTKYFLAFLLFAGVTQAFAETEDRHITGFKGVNVAGSFDVYITQGSTESVKVEAPSDMISRIKTVVEGGVLKIYDKGNSDWNFNLFGNHKRVVVYVSAKDLNAVGASGSGDVYFKGGLSAGALRLSVTGSGDMTGKVEAKELDCRVTGSGDLRINGHAASSNVTVTGSGDYSGHDLITTGTTVRVSGSGDASVNASDKIEASVSGSGDIRYAGGAKHVSTSSSGSGDIHSSGL